MSGTNFFSLFSLQWIHSFLPLLSYQSDQCSRRLSWHFFWTECRKQLFFHIFCCYQAIGITIISLLMEAIFLPSSEFFVAKGVKWKVQVRLQISSKKHITSDIIPWRKKVTRKNDWREKPVVMKIKSIIFLFSGILWGNQNSQPRVMCEANHGKIN